MVFSASAMSANAKDDADATTTATIVFVNIKG